MAPGEQIVGAAVGWARAGHRAAWVSVTARGWAHDVRAREGRGAEKWEPASWRLGARGGALGFGGWAARGSGLARALGQTAVMGQGGGKRLRRVG
jgi:hypothetical protein